MIDNTKVYRCACKAKGLAHVYTADTSGKWVLMVDHDRARFLRDVTWAVSLMHRKSRLLRARASTAAPRIKVGRQLHQLVMRTREKRKRVWAINRSYLDCRRANLRFVSHADARILSSSRRSTKAIGVERPHQPAFFKSRIGRPFHAMITVEGKKLDLAWWATSEEAQSAYDAAAVMVHGPTAATNQSLRLLSSEVAATKVCRVAAKVGRRVIC
jgi:hypothetical protein